MTIKLAFLSVGVALTALCIAWIWGVYIDMTALPHLAMPALPVATIAPAATPQAIPAPASYGGSVARVYAITADSVDVVVDGRGIFALPSMEMAEEIIQSYYYGVAYDLQANERLLSAHVDTPVLLLPASGKYPLFSPEEALQKLQADPSLIPVIKTVHRAQTFVGEVGAETVRNMPQLPRGARIVESFGAGRRELVFSEISYHGGVEISVQESNRFLVGEAEPRSVRIGTFVGSGNATPQREEGPRGKPLPRGMDLRYPVASPKTRTLFGFHGGVMQYGLDVYGAPGAPILAPEDGTVIWCGPRGDYGMVIEIQHGDSGFVSRLALCHSVKVVLYQRVKRGEIIAFLGPASYGRESFMHYEVLVDGVPYNPVYYL